jgi:4-hydroxybenzoate polyprenyltransferase
MLETPKTNQEPLWLVIMRLLRWNKPEGRLILMIPALWAVFLAAGGKPPIPLVGVIILGSIATSAAGCVVNDLWDRDIDPQV